MVTMSLHHSNHQNYDLQTFSRSQTPSSLIRRSFSSPALFPASLRNHGDSLAKIPPFFATSPLSPQFAPSYPLLHSLLTLPVPTTLLVSWTLTLPWLTNEDEQMLLENSLQWLREIIVFALHTGLRQDELLSLQWSRVDLFRKIIIIQESKDGKPRTIPLNRIALDILMEKSKVRNLKSDLVFLSNAITKICCQNLIKAFNTAKDKASIQNFHFHDLRHTFATRLAQKGVDIYKISKLLGHVSITMTQRYAHHCRESLREGIEVLEGVDYNLTTVGKNRNVSNS